MAKRWRIHPFDPERIAALGHAAAIPAVVAQLLICRGIDDPRRARRFLDSRLADLRDPDELPGCTEAARRLHDAIRTARKRFQHEGVLPDFASLEAITTRIRLA